jgi:GNAT superfamily N-acetyltransferase
LIAVRRATAADTPLILAFIRELAAYEGMDEQVEADEAGLRDALFGPSPAAEVILAELDRHPVGFALFFHNFSTFLGRRGLYLEDLYVRPQARGRGVGRALLSELARIAAARGCGRMEWWVLDWNESAIGFYRALGARPMDAWTVYRLEGAPLRDLGAQGDQNTVPADS